MKKFGFFVILLLTMQAPDGNGLWIQTIADMKRELELDNRLLIPKQIDSSHQKETLQSEEKSDNELMSKLWNTTIRVLAKTNLPFLIIRHRGKNNGTIELEGFVGELWTMLEQHLGFKSKVIVGNQSNTRLWDVQLNPKELGWKRMKKYSYTFPITRIWYNLFTKGIPDYSLSMFYFEVLDKKLWTVIVTALVLLSAFLWLAWQIRTAMRLRGSESNNRRDTNFTTCLLSVLGCMTNQGSQFKAESLASIRIITLMCIVLGLLITTSFSALLISKLANFHGTKPAFGKLDLTTLMTKPEGRTVCVANTSSAYRKLADSVLKRKSTLKINRPPCTPGEFDIVPLEDYCWEDAVVLETLYNVIYTLEHDPMCSIFIFNRPNYESQLVLVGQKGFPYMRIINKLILRIKESGIMEHLNDKWMNIKGNDGEHEPDKVIVRFDHVRTIVLLYGVAVAVAIVLLAIEKIVHWLKVQHPNRFSF